MKYKTIIDPEQEEIVIIYAHERNSKVEEIERIASRQSSELVAFYDKNNFKLIEPTAVDCFLVEDGKVIALMEKERLLLKQRLYEIEDMLDDSFVRLNQSCIANIKSVERFDLSFTGTLLVIFKNGHKDYVSRRQLKKVKERIGMKHE